MEGTAGLKTTSVTDDVIDKPFPDKFFGCATGKLKLVLSYLRASMTKSKSGQIMWSRLDGKEHFCEI